MPEHKQRASYKRKYPQGKPISKLAAGVSIRALAQGHKVTLIEKPQPSVFLDNETIARFTAADWESVIQLVAHFFSLSHDHTPSSSVN